MEFSKTAEQGDLEVWTSTEAPPESLDSDSISKLTKEVAKQFEGEGELEAISISTEAGISVRLRVSGGEGGEE